MYFRHSGELAGDGRVDIRVPSEERDLREAMNPSVELGRVADTSRQILSPILCTILRHGSDFIYTKISARPGSDFIYTKNIGGRC